MKPIRSNSPNRYKISFLLWHVLALKRLCAMVYLVGEVIGVIFLNFLET